MTTSSSGAEVEQMSLPPAPALVYVGTDGSTHMLDAENWNPNYLTHRERALCHALLRLALTRLTEPTS